MRRLGRLGGNSQEIDRRKEGGTRIDKSAKRFIETQRKLHLIKMIFLGLKEP